MGNANSTENVQNQAEAINSESSLSKCPVKHESKNTQQENKSIKEESKWKCPFNPKNYGGNVADAKSKCPVAKTKKDDNVKSTITPTDVKVETEPSKCPIQYKNPKQYNVYNQVIDKKNQMPVNPNQNPAPNQAVTLSTNRVSSSIPKGGTDTGTWTYPSPQMFWNAMVRKHKTEGVREHDVDVVVSIHNTMNEITWNQVLGWEALHPVTDQSKEPKLLRFMGRPNDLSPKAILKGIFGHSAPFDRHDWIVDRGGQEVRYVIDYYHDESGIHADTHPKQLTDMHSIQSIKIDARPAIDSFESIIDRLLRMPYLRILGQTSYNPPPFFPPRRMIEAEMHQIEVLKHQWLTIQSQCHEYKEKLHHCKTEKECGAASIALQRCTANVICPEIVKEFDKCIHNKSLKDSVQVENAFKDIEKCLDLFRIDSANALRK